MKYLLSALISAVILIGGIFTGERLVPQQPVSFGATGGIVQGTTFYLSGAGITSSANTIQLTSFVTPDGRPLTISMFAGGIGYGALEPGTSKLEDITFSGITQNANGTALLTGVTRGNDFISPYAASTTLAKSHAGGAQFVLSNTAGFYGNQFLFSTAAGSSTATLTFSNTAPPFYYPGPGAQSTGSPIATTSEFASIAYVNQVVASGAANATAAVKGIIQLATAVQAAAGTALGSTGASLVPPNSLFNATQSATTIIPVTNTSGKLSQLFLDLTQAFTWSGLNTFSAGLLSTASSTFNRNTLHIGATAVNPLFGGTGTDGALSLTSGTTTINLNSQTYVELNYTSVSITGTGNLAFSNPAAGGTFITIKSQGNVTITCTNGTCIDIHALGATTGSTANTFYLFAPNIGSNGSGATPGAGGTVTVSVTPNSIASSTLLKYGGQFWVGVSGGTGGVNVNGGSAGTPGTGGRGAGGLLMEVGGALNMTGNIYAIGSPGGNATGGTLGCAAGGGGGTGGFVKIIYNILTALSGAATITGGLGGQNSSACINVNGGGGGGAGSPYTAGTIGTAASTASTVTGGQGATGYSSFELNVNIF